MKVSPSVDGMNGDRPTDESVTTQFGSSDVRAGRAGTLLRSVAVFAAAGVSSLLLGSWLVSAGGTATFPDAVLSYFRPAIYSSALAAILLYVASLLLPSASESLRLFCHRGRARTGWTAVFIAFLSAGVVGAATFGSDGLTIGMLSASLSGFPVFALVAGCLLGGRELPGTRALTRVRFPRGPGHRDG